MLVLSRKAGQRICIGGSIQISVLEVRRGKVRLGFVAPLQVEILREEISRRIEAEAACPYDKPATEKS